MAPFISSMDQVLQTATQMGNYLYEVAKEKVAECIPPKLREFWHTYTIVSYPVSWLAKAFVIGSVYKLSVYYLPLTVGVGVLLLGAVEILKTPQVYERHAQQQIGAQAAPPFPPAYQGLPIVNTGATSP